MEFPKINWNFYINPIVSGIRILIACYVLILYPNDKIDFAFELLLLLFILNEFKFYKKQIEHQSKSIRLFHLHLTWCFPIKINIQYIEHC